MQTRPGRSFLIIRVKILQPKRVKTRQGFFWCLDVHGLKKIAEDSDDRKLRVLEMWT